jgi:hypothetical protein
MDYKVLSKPKRHELVGSFRPGKTKTTWFSTGPWSAEIHEPVVFQDQQEIGNEHGDLLTALLSGGGDLNPVVFRVKKR